MSEIYYINGYEVKPSISRPAYGASKCGKVFRLDRKKEVAQCEKQGYFYTRTCIDGKPKNSRVHILVAEAWVENPNPETHVQVNHIDGDKLNNSADNLEWCTISYNQRHAIKTGLRGYGESLYNSSYTEEEAHQICQLIVDGWRNKDIAEKFSITSDVVRKIRAGDTWFHVRRQYPINHTYKNTFSVGTVKWVCNRIVEGYSDKSIRDMSTNPNITIIEVKRIREKIRFKEISDEFF